MSLQAFRTSLFAMALCMIAVASFSQSVRQESVTEGTLGDVILNGSAPSYGTFGVFLRANTTGAPDVGVRLGTTGSQPSTFSVFDSAGYPAWNVSFNAPGGFEGTFASLSGNKGYTRMELNNSSPGSGTAASWTQLQFMEGATTKAYLLSINSGSINFPNGPGAFRVWNVANAPMTFATNNTERMRIDAAGNVGIGASAPSTIKLYVAGSVQADQQSLIALDVSGTSPTLQLRPGAGGLLPSLLFSDSANLAIGSVYGYQGNGLIVQSGVNQYIGFRTNNTSPDVMRIHATGNVGIGTLANTYKLDVAGTVNVSGAFTGTSATFSGTVTGSNIRANYQDVAEWVPATESLSAGTVVILDPSRSNHVVPSSRPYDTSVAGVVSARPGIILGEEGDSKAMIATTGRVRVRVDATTSAIAIGDLLVTSDKPGMAMKSVPLDLQGIAIHRPGTVVGKALESLAGGEGEILVLLSLQ